MQTPLTITLINKVSAKDLLFCDLRIKYNPNGIIDKPIGIIKPGLKAQALPEIL